MKSIKEKVELAVKSFLVKEEKLLATDSSERNLAQKLATMLEQSFEDWEVDCEYNRNQTKIKRLMYAIGNYDIGKAKNVIPDIIVHKRMTQDNLVVIEIKKVRTQNRMKKI